MTVSVDAAEGIRAGAAARARVIPAPVAEVLRMLHNAGYEAFVVGGCVRDVLLQRTPQDWDVTTNAHPEEVQAVFPDSFYENDFGTVGVKVAPFLPHGDTARTHDIIEVTTYRTESAYSDHRRPDTVQFVQTLHQDLARRDFTMNAIAMTEDGVLRDPFNGRRAITQRQIVAVGDAATRFREDALRMMRAVRFAAQLRFVIDPDTRTAIRDHAKLLRKIAMERIRDEFSKIVLSDHPMQGIQLLHDTGLLAQFLPELEEGIGVEQNHHHIYTVWEHNLRALQTCPSSKLSVRLGTLLHDVGKPRAKRGTGRNCTFYNHEYIGERMTRKILTRLRYPKQVVRHAALLVRNHMFYYSVGEVTETAVRRVIAKVGRENIKDLLDLRIGDRLGSGSAKAMPYKLRHFQYMVDKVSNDAVSVKMLKINGNTLITELGLTPGPKVGAVLDALLAEVIDDAAKNTRAYLLTRAAELAAQDIEELRRAARERIRRQRAEDDAALRRKYRVR